MPTKWILKLYPPVWRQRYEEEMLALLAQHHVTWRTWMDLLRGALDARCDPHFKTPKGLFPGERIRLLRRAHSTIFWAFPLLLLGHLFFLDELDDAFYPWNRAHAFFWKFKAIASVMIAIGFLAFLLTGLILACVLAKQAMKQSEKGLRALPLGGFGIALAFYGLHLYAPSAIFCLVLLFMTVGPFVLAFTISRYELPPKLLGCALAPVALTVTGMVAQSLFIAVWGWAIWNVSAQSVQQMAQAADRHLLSGEGWHLQLLGGLLWMTLMTGWALWRLGWAMIGFMRKERPGAEAA